MQNADDAGATKVTFCLDNRQHGTTSLAYDKLAPFQGPALYVHNNSVFSEADFQSISRIGDSGKREQAGKTGKGASAGSNPDVFQTPVLHSALHTLARTQDRQAHRPALGFMLPS